MAPRPHRARACGLALALAAPALAWAQPACEPWVEVLARDGGIHLRTHRDALTPCTLDEPAYGRLVSAWLATPGARAVALRWVFLGRAVDYPWIARHLAQAARADPAWDADGGRPRAGGVNAYVAGLLERPALRARLGAPFAGSGYRIAGVSVEKVLVPTARALRAGAAPVDARVPYDAQIWLRVEPSG